MSHPVLTLLSSEEVKKGWGKETILVNNEEFCGKLLSFKKGAKFSMHYHKEKREVFFVLRGRLTVKGIYTENAAPYEKHLTKGDVLDVPRGCLHQIRAETEAVIVEFSTHHEDSDSYRVAPGDSQK